MSKHAPALEIVDLEKSFGSLPALRGVSLKLSQGERLALLGPNGAGKTTLIRCLAGRTRPDAGEILLQGHAVDQPDARHSLGIVPQEIALYGDLSARENLAAFAKFQGLNRREVKERVQWALEWTGLSDRANDLVAGFSGGMKRRVNLACGVMHSPKVVLLDEPTVGVDPQSRQRIFAMLDELNREGASILLTTHHLEEAEQRSDRIVILDHGKVIADGTIDDLISQSVGDSRLVRMKIDRPLDAPMVTATDDRLGDAGDQVLSTRIDDVSQQLPYLLSLVRGSGYGVSDLEVQAPSMHHVFLHLTGHELRD